MTRVLFLLAGIAELAVGLMALSAIGSDIQIIAAQCGIGFGLTHLALAVIIGRMRPSPETR